MLQPRSRRHGSRRLGPTAGRIDLDFVRRWLVEELPFRRWPGGIIDATSERVAEFRPSWPLPGPNGVRVLRCSSERLKAVVDGVRELALGHGVQMIWMLDEQSRIHEPALRELGMTVESETAELALLDGQVEADMPAGVRFVDGMGSLDEFRKHLVAVEGGFAGDDAGGNPIGDIERRYREGLETPEIQLITAYVDGEPAGGGALALWSDGARLGGGSLMPRFRGRGIYRALVAERVRRARRAGVHLITTNARLNTSGPILRRLGFLTVARRWSLRDVVES